jgi:DNA-binding LacI/PurR family transcriptional regulator
MARSVHMATVHQPLHEMGRRAVEVLAAHRGAAPERAVSRPLRIVLPTEIVAGETLAEPRRKRRAIA